MLLAQMGHEGRRKDQFDKFCRISEAGIESNLIKSEYVTKKGQCLD